MKLLVRRCMSMRADDGDGRTYLWNVTNHNHVAALSGPGVEGWPGYAPSAALFSPMNDALATTESDGNVYLWNIPTRKVAAAFISPDATGVLGLGFTLTEGRSPSARADDLSVESQLILSSSLQTAAALRTGRTL